MRYRIWFRGLVIARDPALSWPGVSAVRVSLTDSIVWRGPLMRRTFRNPRTASAAPTTSMIANTIKYAAHCGSQLPSSSARKKKKKNVE